MSTHASTNPIRQLAEAFAGINSTEELIIFVAGKDHMLAFCQELIEQFDRNPHDPLIRQADSICAGQGILPGVLFSEIRKVLLALNKFHDVAGDHYSVLGLPPDASREQIKKAYRSLSKKHHPDGLAEDDGKRFMEISGAYHALMLGFVKKKDEQGMPWRKKSAYRPVPSSHRNRKVFFGMVIALAAVLTAISVFLSARYHRKAVISQFEANIPAQIPYDSPAAVEFHPEEPAGPSAITEELQIEEPPATPAISRVEARFPAAPDKNSGTPESPAAQVLMAQSMPPALEPRPPSSPQDIGHEQEPAGKIVEDQEPAIQRPDPEPVHPEPVYAQPPLPVGSLEMLPEDAAETGNNSRDTASAVQEERKIIPARTGGGEKEKPSGNQDAAPAIDEFINHYAQQYNNRELSPFLALFAENATENGRPVATMIEQYKSLFAQTRDIHFLVLNLNWQEKQDGFEATGDFQATYAYNDGRSSEHNGAITFHISNDRGEMKIHSLDYVFKK
ncbi:MAG: DnaJ domain-containing protein [Desulfobulbaceae bacterium]|nr:DnaJ domain-containing protein [Desulfobulbaceae bacterium]